MMRFALRSLAGRKFRAIATALAIVLGVAMVAGTFVLTDTIDKAFSNDLHESYAGTDAVVSAKAVDITFQGDQADTEPMPASRCSRRPGVDSVERGHRKRRRHDGDEDHRQDGKAIDTNGAPSFGFGIDPSPDGALQPAEHPRRPLADGADEVVVDAGTADDAGLQGRRHDQDRDAQAGAGFKLVGIARYGSVESLGSATFAVFDIPTAQKLLHREGQFDAISVAAKDGVTPEQLVAGPDQALPPTAR